MPSSNGRVELISSLNSPLMEDRFQVEDPKIMNNDAREEPHISPFSSQLKISSDLTKKDGDNLTLQEENDLRREFARLK